MPNSIQYHHIQHTHSDFYTQMCNEETGPIYQARFLGIIIDSELTPHLDNLYKKLHRSVHAIKRITIISDTKTALTANHALFDGENAYCHLTSTS